MQFFIWFVHFLKKMSYNSIFQTRKVKDEFKYKLGVLLISKGQLYLENMGQFWWKHKKDIKKQIETSK